MSSHSGRAVTAARGDPKPEPAICPQRNSLCAPGIARASPPSSLATAWLSSRGSGLRARHGPSEQWGLGFPPCSGRGLQGCPPRGVAKPASELAHSAPQRDPPTTRSARMGKILSNVLKRLTAVSLPAIVPHYLNLSRFLIDRPPGDQTATRGPHRGRRVRDMAVGRCVIGEAEPETSDEACGSCHCKLHWLRTKGDRTRGEAVASGEVRSRPARCRAPRLWDPGDRWGIGGAESRSGR